MITEEHLKSLDALLKCCLENDELLSDWENDFVSDYTERLSTWGEKLNVSDKQNEIFNRLEKKLIEAGVL